MRKIISILLFAALFIGCEKDNSTDTDVKLIACFTYTISNSMINGIIPIADSIIFENCSKNATSYLWDFGDGTTSTQENPIHIYEQSPPFIISLTAYNSSNYDVLIDTIPDWAMVYKPNIYIYPEHTIYLCVNLSFPQGGKVIKSIPEYTNGWCINVEPSGKINGIYNYLFYESMQPDIWQKNKGWIVSKSNLTTFFIDNMESYGFNSNEIADFIEYWIPLLTNSDLYAVYPQTKKIIDQVVQIGFSFNPNNVNRLFYVVNETDENIELQKPVILPFNKNRFYVNEWGVILR